MTPNWKSHPVEYRALKNAIYRCHNPSHHAYANYGGRGIEVCARWQNSFMDFLSDLGPKPSPQLSLERIDNHGNYEPGNCAWRSASEQQKNKRPSGQTIAIYGETKTVREWADQYGLTKFTVRNRYNAGFRGSDLIAPVGSLR